MQKGSSGDEALATHALFLPRKQKRRASESIEGGSRADPYFPKDSLYLPEPAIGLETLIKNYKIKN
jgi:hypothetical protein